MTRQELIRKLEEIKEVIAWDRYDMGLGSYAVEHARYAIGDAIQYLKENADDEDDAE